MSDKELLTICKAYRSGFLRGRSPSSRGMCFAMSVSLQGYLRAIGGIKTKLIEGRVKNSIWNHFWLQMEDGRIIDATMDQFDNHRGTKSPKIYIGQIPDDYIIGNDR